MAIRITANANESAIAKIRFFIAIPFAKQAPTSIGHTEVTL
jgi:hypothetical protein